MNSELQQALIDVVKGLTAAAEQAGSVAKEQLPLVVREYLALGAWSHGLGVAAGLLIIGVGVALGVLANRRWKALRAKERTYSDPDPFVEVCLTVGSIVACIFGSVYAYHSLNSLLVVVVSPRVYILRAAAELIK